MYLAKTSNRKCSRYNVEYIHIIIIRPEITIEEKKQWMLYYIIKFNLTEIWIVKNMYIFLCGKTKTKCFTTSDLHTRITDYTFLNIYHCEKFKTFCFKTHF